MTIEEYWRRAKARQRHFERLAEEKYEVLIGQPITVFDHTDAGRPDRRCDTQNRILGIDGQPIDDE